VLSFFLDNYMIVGQYYIGLMNKCRHQRGRNLLAGIRFRLLAIVWATVAYLCTATTIKAQDRLELGGFIGTSYYLGDLNPGGHFANPHLAIGAIGRYVVNDRWALKGAYTFGTISGGFPKEGLTYPTTSNDSYAFERKLNDLALMAEFNFLSYDHAFLSKTVFTPYITVGLATTMYSRFDIDSPSSDGTTVFVLSLPFGAGMKYKLTNWVRVGVEWTLRKTFVDDLDYTGGISPVDPSDPYGFGQMQMSHNNDWYSFAGVTLTFNLVRRKTSCNSGY
jgi:opacity protein-like surface antigen